MILGPREFVYALSFPLLSPWIQRYLHLLPLLVLSLQSLRSENKQFAADVAKRERRLQRIYQRVSELLLLLGASHNLIPSFLILLLQWNRLVVTLHDLYL